MNGWNLTYSVINFGILTCYKTSLDFVDISESVISGRLFLSYNGPVLRHLWDGSFEHPKHMLKLMDKKMFTI